MTTTNQIVRKSPAGLVLSFLLSPPMLVVIAITSVQVGASLAKGLFPITGSNGVVFMRTALATVMLGLVWRPVWRGYGWREYAQIVLYGANIAMMMLGFYAAISRIPLGVAVAISFAGPLGIAVLTSRKLGDILWVLVAGVGVLLLSPLTNEALDPVGVFLAFISALGWAFYVLLTKQVTRTMSGNGVLVMAMAVAALVAAPFGMGGAVHILAAPSYVLLAVVVAFLSSSAPFALEYQAMKRLSPRAFGLLLSLEPMMAALMGLLILGETLGLSEWLGIAMVSIAAASTARGNM